METYYTIYKTVNQLNQMIYIGMHKTKNLDDDYLGSGTLLQEAISRFGKENFTKEILHTFNIEEEMEEMETKLVNKDFVARSDTYNQIQGGTNGYKLINAIPGLNNSAGQNLKGAKIHKDRFDTDPDYREWFREILREARAKYGPTFLGKKHTVETKKKMRAAAKGKHSGEHNNNYGKCWIYSIEEKCNKSIQQDELNDWLAKGWIKGRKMKF